MAQLNNKELTTLPVGRLGLIPLDSCRPLGEKVNEWLVKWRKERENPELGTCAFEGYQRDSYIINVKTPRFGSGEGKGEISESVRGDDIYVMVDVCNHSINYTISGYTNMMSPDDHFQDLKRAIAAVGGKARRVNVIMPYLYESRQSKRIGRESLDCASALQELTKMGVENIITFDAHDSRVQNATPLHGFETIQPSYQFIKALLNNVEGLHIDNDHFMIISPDEGSMRRAIYLANVLGVDMGMYYRRLDYTKVVKGRHPIAAYEFLGPKLEGKDVILIDDMISSGSSILEIASLLKKRGAGKIFICTTLSPDDHFQDLKRAIAAVGGKARRVNVIMPYLYESRQSKRIGRESLDCASALQELTKMGVENIITFDAHDSRVQNATPLHGFETIQPSYQFIKALLNNVEGLHIDNDHFMIISPDEGSMRRAIYLANVLGVDMGMYYRRLDYTKVVKGRHPIAAYEFLGPKLEGKDVILIDDMISSGSSILEIASLLKKRGAGKIFICTTFGLFTEGMEKFDAAYAKGTFDKLLTTNLVYQDPELLARDYYISCDLSKYIALIIDTLNHDMSVSHLLNPADRIKKCVNNYMAQYDK